VRPESSDLIRGGRALTRIILRLGVAWVAIAPFYYLASTIALYGYLAALGSTWLAGQFPLSEVLLHGVQPMVFLVITGILGEIHDVRADKIARAISWRSAKWAWATPILSGLLFWALDKALPKAHFSVWFGIGMGSAIGAGAIVAAFVVRMNSGDRSVSWLGLLVGTVGLLLGIVVGPFCFGRSLGIEVLKGERRLPVVHFRPMAESTRDSTSLLLLHADGRLYVLNRGPVHGRPRTLISDYEDVDWIEGP
jgi:hypothetical protein